MMPRRMVEELTRVEGEPKWAIYRLDCGHEVRRRLKLSKRWALCDECSDEPQQ